jgi:acyl carrier protein
MQRTIDRRKDVVHHVKEAVIEGLNLDLQPDEMSEDSALFGFGLGLDSIDALTLMVSVEDRFGVLVPEDNVRIFRSINTIADFIAEHDHGRQ